MHSEEAGGGSVAMPSFSGALGHLLPSPLQDQGRRHHASLPYKPRSCKPLRCHFSSMKSLQSDDSLIRLRDDIDELERHGKRADFLTYLGLLRRCGHAKFLSEGRRVHQHLRRSGHARDRILANIVVEMYGKCGALEDARSTFDEMRRRNLLSWNIMITAYEQNGHCDEALQFFRQMLAEGIAPDRFTFSSILGACSSTAFLVEGQSIHASVAEAGLDADAVVGTSLVNMYGKCGSLEGARRVFERICHRDVVSWNAMISAYVQHGNDEESFLVFYKMEEDDVEPTDSTFLSVLGACASSAAGEQGKLIHASVVDLGLEVNVAVGTALVNMYGKCGNLENAQRMFEKMHRCDVVAWNTIIGAYAQYGSCKEAIGLFWLMVAKGGKPDHFTFGTAISVCSNLEALVEGKSIHASAVNEGFESHVVIGNALVNMYGKCGKLDNARMMFDKMFERSVVSWNAMITAYVQHGLPKEALELYRLMDLEGMKPNDVTFISVLGACASLAALGEGKWIHSRVVDTGYESEAVVGTALVHMYSKCGNLEEAEMVFDKVSERNLVCWNVIIAAHAQHGNGTEALQLFLQMQPKGIQPDAITFVNILHACSHAGLVNEAKKHFTSMVKDHSILPTVEHYGCMIDLLGRFGQLEEAEDFLNKMPLKGDVVAWKALLGACRIHGDVERAKRVAEQVIKLDPKMPEGYVLLSNIYAA